MKKEATKDGVAGEMGLRRREQVGARGGGKRRENQVTNMGRKPDLGLPVLTSRVVLG